MRRQVATPEPFDQKLLHAAEEALRILPVPDENSRRYLEEYVPRLARTMALAPPGETGRVREPGCYIQITPLLEGLSGYREVRGAYYGNRATWIARRFRMGNSPA